MIFLLRLFGFNNYPLERDLASNFELVQGDYTSLNNELLTIRKSENFIVKLFSI